MKLQKNYLLRMTLIVAVLLCFHRSQAQDIIQIEPLFEYPVAPEELPSLSEKSDYLVNHFWDNFDFKNKEAVNQIALNDAFKVYASPLRWANINVANQGIEKLIASLSGNPTLMLQFTNAAEEALYGPRADFWIDEIYLKFLDASLKNKKIPDNRKSKLKLRADILKASKIGETAPSFKFENQQGIEQQYFPMTTPSILIFADPEDMDWRLLRLRLETNSVLNHTVEKGKLNILFIVPIEREGWEGAVSNYPAKWVIGNSPTIGKQLDIRLLPSAYLVGSDGKIVMKNVSPETAINAALALMQD